ncbi:MAG: hypothetical protein IT460_03335 [Planctomycetes bacterium]|nr:hypothetical protein [Planctomycetota bacterium]
MGPDLSARARRRPARGDRGFAIVWAMLAAMLIAGIVFAGTSTQIAMNRLGDATFSAEGQARSVAEAGLVDALAWFRRQQTQPVSTFAPQRNLAANPVVNETDDTVVGLVREYEMMPSLWARYEVRKPVAAESFTDQDADGRYDYGEPYLDTNGNGRRDPAREIRDISVDRGFAGTGTVWWVVSHGAVYRRRDAAQPLGSAANPKVASADVAAEVRRFVIVPPATSALCVKTGTGTTIGARARLLGGSKGGLITKSGTGTPTVQVGSEVYGSPAVGTNPTYDDSISTTFGVTMPELKAMADASWSSAALFPAKIGDFTLNIVPGPITFDDSRPLRGTGVVVVEGNCTIAAGSNSFFNGILYVQGTLTVRAPVYLRGTVIVTGTADVAGTGGDFSEINYDPAILNEVLTMLGQYRFSTATYEPSEALPDGTPDEGNLVRLQHSGMTLPGAALPAPLDDSLPPVGMGG